MRIKCQHGYFVFDETKVGQISDFISYTGMTIVPVEGHYTFLRLENAPRYSLEGKAFLGFVAKQTFEGTRGEVFAANGCVYNFALGTVVPIESITTVTTIRPAGNRFVSPGLILPGSLTAEGKRVKDYAAWFSRDRQTFLYTDVTYV